MRLYLAEGSCDSLGDWEQWTIGVFTTRAKAKAACRSAVKPSVLDWTYNARSGDSVALVSFDKWTPGSVRVRRIQADEIVSTRG